MLIIQKLVQVESLLLQLIPVSAVMCHVYISNSFVIQQSYCLYCELSAFLLFFKLHMSSLESLVPTNPWCNTSNAFSPFYGLATLRNSVMPVIGS